MMSGMWDQVMKEEESYWQDGMSDEYASPRSCRSDGLTQSDIEDLEVALYSQIHYSSNIDSTHPDSSVIEDATLLEPSTGECRNDTVRNVSPETVVISSDADQVDHIDGQKRKNPSTKTSMLMTGVKSGSGNATQNGGETVLNVHTSSLLESSVEESCSKTVPVITLSDTESSDENSNTTYVHASIGKHPIISRTVSIARKQGKIVSEQEDTIKQKKKKAKQKKKRKKLEESDSETGSVLIINDSGSENEFQEHSHVLSTDTSTNIVWPRSPPSKRICQREKSLKSAGSGSSVVASALRTPREMNLRSWSEEMVHLYDEPCDVNINQSRQSMPDHCNLWILDQADRCGGFYRRPLSRYFQSRSRVRCHNCSQWGHHKRDCPEEYKIPCCYMCGETGHKEPACPYKMCMQCGTPNFKYRDSCKKCSNMAYIHCGLCKFRGHRTDRCPDLWRRFHSTTKEGSLESSSRPEYKPRSETFCANCARKGHLYHECKERFWSSYPPVSPYVVSYENNFTKTHNAKVKGGSSELYLTKTLYRQALQLNSSVLRDIRRQTGVEIKFAVGGSTTGKHNLQFFGSLKARTQAKTLVFKHLTASKKNKTKNVIKKGCLQQNNMGTAGTDTYQREIRNPMLNQNSFYFKSASWLQGNENADRCLMEGNSWKSQVGISKRMIGNELCDKVKNHKEYTVNTNQKMGEKVLKINNENSAVIEKIKCKEATPGKLLSSVKFRLIAAVENSLKKLVSDLPNVNKSYSTICRLREQYKNIADAPSFEQIKWTRALSKLNFAVRGQAGLGNGHYHIKQLVKLISELKTVVRSFVPKKKKMEIENHYYRIFMGYEDSDTYSLVEQYLQMKGNKRFDKQQQLAMKSILECAGIGSKIRERQNISPGYKEKVKYRK